MAKQASTISTGGIGLDLRDFARFAKALRKAAPELAAQLKIRLRAAGEVVAETARSNAEAASRTIPSSIKVRVSGATISVVAGGAGIPLAGLMEMGNAGGSDGAALFRHPLWGHWVSGKGIQATHPYLLPAIQSDADAAEIAAVEALDWAIGIATA